MPSLEEKIGALMMVGFDGHRPPGHILDWLASGRIGGVYLFARNVQSPAQLKSLVDDCREAARRPILVGIDQEGGIVARLRQGFTESPGNMALGAARDSQLAEDIAFMLGRELAALGINWNFAPVADIAHQPENPSLSARSIGADHELVSRLVQAQIRGFQRAGIAATVKHFPGLGNTVIDTHEALAKLSGSLDLLYESEILPFRAAIDADVACVMLTHVMYEALDDRHPATLSPRIVSGLLRQELGYAGAVCTDCMEMRAISDGYGPGEAAVLAFEAGVDMPLYSHTRAHQEAAYEALLRAARSGRITSERIDASLARIDKLKADYPLHERPPLEIVACQAHQSLALEAARAGIALVKGGESPPISDRHANTLLIEFTATRVSDAIDAESSSEFASALGKRLDQLRCITLDPVRPERQDIDEALRGAERLIIVTRNAHLHPAQRELALRIVGKARHAIVICARNPYDAGLFAEAERVLCANGDSAPSLQAAADAILGAFLPAGRLSVPLP